ncbi:hypothetical protein EVAR_27308_1 [Eumeta japonica]|uniref:Uncharacterized protein n=1 Tax=Eumeta variegata TaxID=151549 RepID=A0A4C1UCB3_EUMVA|nr:hypothetical protein EVAR_27308_1 [Eumeta japonica]
MPRSLAEAVTTKAGPPTVFLRLVGCPVPVASSGRRAPHSFIAQRWRPRGRVLRSQHESRRFVARHRAPLDTSSAVAPGVAQPERRITVTRIRALFEYTAAKCETSVHTIECASTDVLRIDEGTMLSPPERDDLAVYHRNIKIFLHKGRTDAFAEHRIDTGDHPHIVPPYRLTPNL